MRLKSQETGGRGTKAFIPVPQLHPPQFKVSIKKCLVRHGAGGLEGSPFGSGATGARQEMFAEVASVRLTRHYTRICSLGMLLRLGPPGCRILMLRRALYYI